MNSSVLKLYVPSDQEALGLSGRRKMLEFRYEVSPQRLSLQCGCVQRRGFEEVLDHQGSDIRNRCHQVESQLNDIAGR